MRLRCAMDLRLDSPPYSRKVSRVQTDSKDSNTDSNTMTRALADAAAVLIDFDGVIIDSEWPIYQY